MVAKPKPASWRDVCWSVARPNWLVARSVARQRAFFLLRLLRGGFERGMMECDERDGGGVSGSGQLLLSGEVR